MIETSRIKAILSRFSKIKLAVLGDFFLDLYIEMDRSLSEFSLETHKEAFQAFAVRGQPGAAGVVTKNLTALGAQTAAISYVGKDGNGNTLLKALVAQGVNIDYLIKAEDRLTPTYIKPIMKELDGSKVELNRIDIINRSPNVDQLNRTIMEFVNKIIQDFDGILVLEQVKQDGYGTMSPQLRGTLRKISEKQPEKIILVDSRHFASEYQRVSLKLNLSEAAQLTTNLNNKCATVDMSKIIDSSTLITQAFWAENKKPIFITMGAEGISGMAQDGFFYIPGFQLEGPIDPVGAGDSVLAGIGLALCAGATPREAAYLGNLVGSITIQQLGTTGFVTQDKVFQRHLEYQDQINHEE